MLMLGTALGGVFLCSSILAPDCWLIPVSPPGWSDGIKNGPLGNTHNLPGPPKMESMTMAQEQADSSVAWNYE